MAPVLDCLLRCTLAGVQLTRTLWTGLSCDVLGGLIWPSRNGRRRTQKPARAARETEPARGRVRGAGFEPALLAWQANVTTRLYYPRASGRQARRVQMAFREPFANAAGVRLTPGFILRLRPR